MNARKIVGLMVMIGLIIAAVLVLVRLDVLPKKTYIDADFDIVTYVSSIDRDNDGLDDQSDLLQGVKDYIATNPKYKSKYYATGYPDDGYGVCTDVVAFGLLSAGYDLQQLVAQDIANHPGRYDITSPDANIDFRRVVNLLVYFQNNAINLTTDLEEIDQFQGGDIVVFKNHIGIISNWRNASKVPYLIHHAGVWQLHYEEDALKRQGAMLGHFRIS